MKSMLEWGYCVCRANTKDIINAFCPSRTVREVTATIVHYSRVYEGECQPDTTDLQHRRHISILWGRKCQVDIWQ